VLTFLVRFSKEDDTVDFNSFFFEFLLDSTLIMSLCEILYNVSNAALA